MNTMSQSILIAEDNDFTALQYDKILRKYSYQVTITKDREECLRKYEDENKKNKNEYESPFDVVILDHSMPKKKGKEVASDILKINPIIDWTWDQIQDYIKKNNLPQNSLLDKGYPSVGCEPCTRPIKPGEDLRAGRWWWEEGGNKECGLHIDHK